MAFRTSLHRSSSFRASLLLGLSGLALCASACSGTGNSDETTGAGGTTSGPTSGSGGEGGGFNPTTGSGGDGGGFEQCATSADEATLVPLNMILMFDRSGSMQNNNKWNNATAALKAFVQDPGSAGLRVALRFFPDSGCDENSCSINNCSQPLINTGTLTADPAPADAHEQALVSAINNATPNGNSTPLYPALGGAAQWATNYVTANPTEKAIVILVTDGQPVGCNTNTNAIAGLAGDAFNNAGVLTYGVGLVGSAENVMNQIAAQGGTGQGIFIGNGNAQQDLLDALKAIQGSQVSCEFQMPESTNGDPIDPAKVNVSYTSGSGVETTIGQVSGPNACSGVAGGWYYDNPEAPSTITLCPSTCGVVQADSEAKIQIIVGCATKPAD